MTKEMFTEILELARNEQKRQYIRIDMKDDSWYVEFNDNRDYISHFVPWKNFLEIEMLRMSEITDRTFVSYEEIKKVSVSLD